MMYPISLNFFLYCCFILTPMTLFWSLSSGVQAGASNVDVYPGVVQVARYSVLRPGPTQSQVDLFGTTRSVVISRNIVSVKEALELILADSGYRLAIDPMMPSEANTLLAMPLPDAHRRIDPLPLKEILQLIAGPAFAVVHDPVHRLIAFERCRTPKTSAEIF